jgi:CRISPR-associated endonuclease/helicase Cas3
LKPWGKFGADGSYHPLVDHCLDVSVVFRFLLDQNWMARVSNLKDGQKDRLAAVAFLHDLGKCNWGFQAKADPHARETAGHVMEALAFLYDLSNLWPPAWVNLITEVSDWFADPEQAAQLLVASISHHGRPISLEYDFEQWITHPKNRHHRNLWKATEDYAPLAAIDALAQTVRETFPEAFRKDIPLVDANPALQHRFAGLLMLADWIGSDTQFFPFRRNAQEDRRAFACSAAQKALQAIGLTPPEHRQPKPFASVFPFAPTPLQTALADTLEVGDTTRLLLVESDTGSGKTEAALAWFFRLYAQRHVDGLYFALPTRVAAREIYDRVRHAVDTAFEPELRPRPVLLAAPGYVKVEGFALPPLLVDPLGILWDDNAEDLRREQLWSAERPKRFLAAPIAVGTIDQALLSVLQVKHSLMRSVCLDRHLLVVDEVHASDPYMREVLRGLLRGHLARGGWALLLSATLGESAAAAYFERDTVSLEEAIARPYPLVSAHSQAWPVPAARERRVHLELSPTLMDDEALLPDLITALESGTRVLVVCNTVARANTLFRQVEKTLSASHPHLLPALFNHQGVCCPHHGRFAREDREQLDAAVTAQLGKGSPAGARLLIGTQTLEQSLDIDADWLITDLAPMDVLIQRLGRLHRHARHHRPQGFETPKARIRVPARDLTQYLDKRADLRAPAGLGSVYADGRVLACTWNILQQHPVLELPRQARVCIERTTHPEAMDALPEAWQKHGQQLAGRVQAEANQALRSLLDDKPFGELHYADKSEQVLTRLGDPTLDLPLAELMRSPFGAILHRVSIPARWLPGIEAPDAVAAEPFPDGFRFTIADKSFRYTRFGLEKDDA